LPNIDGDRVNELGKALDTKILPILESTDENLEEVASIQQTLYTSVNTSLAIAYTGAMSFMTEMAQGSAECFIGLTSDLSGVVESWNDADKGAEKDLE
jgi:hypothetical protein